MRSEEEVRRALDQYSDTVRRLCFVRLKKREDADDIFQDVFYKYARSTAAFESAEHEKAWFIRVTLNACRDFLKRFSRRNISLEELADIPAEMPPDNREVLSAVLSLPEKYRQVVYLHYYEGYTAPQIGSILKKNPNTVYTLLTRSKNLLRERLGGKNDD